MSPPPSGGLRELETWLRSSVAEAEERLPALLDLPAAMLRRELDARPELRTAGMMQRLIAVAQEALERYPRRAHELTSIVVEYAPALEASPERASVVRRIEGQGWQEHARALCALQRSGEAREALATARRLFGQTPANDWYIATVDLVEAPLLHDDGRHAEALELARHAASEFAMHHDYQHLVEARMLETWMLSVAGDDAAAADVWTATEEIARQRGHRTLHARLTGKIALFRLRRGDAAAASRLLAEAVEIFEDEGLTREAIRARWNLAEAATARGRLHEAISEYYKVRATLLATGATNDAAIVSAEIVEPLLVAGRDAEVPALAESLLATFRTTLTQNALEAFTWLHARAAAGTLTREDACTVRRFFEDLPHQPRARFEGTD
jgi:tetratricopeptide (TPR) repeat protein